MSNITPQKELALIVPILKGKVKDVEQLAASLSSSKSEEYGKSQMGLGIEKESWFLASSVQGDYVIVYIASNDVSKSMSKLISSKEPFDLWIKNEVGKITGVDWNNPPSMALPKQILRYGP